MTMWRVTQSVVLFLWMYSLTLVTCQDCTLKDFIDGPLFHEGFDTFSMLPSYPSGKSVRVSCSTGYVGFFKLICSEGTWTSVGAKCNPKSCGNPGEAPFAEFRLVKGNDYVFGSQVEYTCNKGHQMVSRSNLRNCLAGGWDGVIPVCQPVPCKALQVDNNVRVFGDLDGGSYGKVLRFSCRSSIEVLDGPHELVCKENGQWDGKPPKCQIIKCVAPDIENGIVTQEQPQYDENQFLFYTCKPLYQRVSEIESKCVKTGATAGWSPTPGCREVRCSLSAVQGTSYDPPFKTSFKPFETLTVTCPENYYIKDPKETSAVTTCKENGHWSIDTSCIEFHCPREKPTGVSSWGVSSWLDLKVGKSVQYECRQGYKPTKADKRLTCSRRGWTPDPPCTERGCERREIMDATIVSEDIRPSYNHKDEVRYVCKDKFVGRFTLTCDKGDWRGQINCKDKGCTEPITTNGQIVGVKKNSYDHNDQVQYKCKDNPEEQVTITCKSGSWTGMPTCLGCPTLNIPHGFAVGPFNEAMYYTCEEDYKLSTKGWWNEAHCVNNTWSEISQCIEKNKCGKIEVPNAELEEDKQTQIIKIVCNERYKAQVESLTCVDGDWNSQGFELKEICIPVDEQCDSPPKVDNAVILTPYQKKYLSDTTVKYKCRDTYTMKKEDTIQCKAGQWEKRDIECTPPQTDK